MPKARILIVEDDSDILHLLAYNIEAAGFDVVKAMDGNTALEMVRRHPPDLVVLDLMIPGIDGFEVCKELKRGAETRGIPVIMLTARGEEVDRIVGLELGADDYVVKPFSPRELILRIRAILRRSATDATEERIWRSEGLSVDFEGHKLTVDGAETPLTATEFKLLAEFVRTPGKVLTRDQLLDRVWAYQFEGYARTVDTHVRRLRRKLGPHADRVETVRGVGYRFRG
ncbi:response regulator [Syntrophobacter fumaroxidans]|uniref:Phosphate regulon transcriptional regulatory protein PhoB n=1 Tax=Syntrophobacter fumaroxidans (strain DSM 10017 / MPOB) TaxID=335543 RepID=A0LMB7_SYNFM|nr:response regulator [Syntrophobacter fumaroxidans]ABK18569.1 two component transcriptional regulator, winged helix family [Syntrophobacter fumaroxidans MPOB]